MFKNKSHVCCRLFTLLIFNLFFLILLIPCSLKCQEDDSLYYTNPDYHIAKELFTRRIVMLGDYGHSQPGPYHHVLNTLDNWLKICATKNKDVHLTLILETEKEKTDEINKYIMTDDMSTLIDKFAPGFFLEDLEFYTQLRNFSRRLDSVNNSRTNKLFFNIKGFEEVGNINFEKQALRSRRESELWFVNERDSTTAMGIINYINSKHDEQILMFYGTAHLHNGYLNKNLGFDDLTEKECMGYYLPYYLKKEFGNEKVITYFTLTDLDDYIYNPALKIVRGQDFITDPINLNLPDFQYNNLDYVMGCHGNYVVTIDAINIFSGYILKKIIENLNIYSHWLPGYKATTFYNRHLNAINLLTGNKFLDNNKVNDWFNRSSFDVSNRLYSNQFTDSLQKLFSDKQKSYLINNILSKFGISAIDQRQLQNFEKWKVENLPKILRQIIFTNSIGIFWFGYPDEKIKAKEYLKQFSGEDFQEPEKYLQWYRMKYYGFEY
jgi:hypothetical protein